ncbi:hypothetical protein QR680_002587 [Steinernema hermaphroditum]|uniref:Endoplasmic reticulum transmembrane protein n=1 Tax=Steinernema hermaphroditum TaxID=289476 RepID=A0AA39H393_9BILA|nr:hypothetical protein QR680_002587 [Steinernema hermaphroditum]
MRVCVDRTWQVFCERATHTFLFSISPSNLLLTHSRSRYTIVIMTIQWTVVAATLYTEICVVVILLLPWIRPTLWNKFFKSRAISAVMRFTTLYSYVGISILLLLFFDGVREVRKYSDSSTIERSSHTADADALMHMRLFRAQRNLYISGFALLLFLVIKRICGLIMRGAQLEASSEVAIKQAESANKTANDLLALTRFEDTEVIEDLQRQINELGEIVKQKNDEAEHIRESYFELRDEYHELISSLSAKSASGDKKHD